MNQEKPEQNGWVLGVWLGCLLLVGLLWFTPLELAPRPLENLPRWGLWLLAVPACRRLQAHWTRLRRLWAALPWLLWGPLALVLTLYVLGWLSDNRPQAGYWLGVNVLECVADDRVSRTTHVLFRRGRQEVVHQVLVPFHATAPRTLRLWRTVQVTHVVPGVRWITWLPEPANLDASWQAANLDGRDAEEQYYMAYKQLTLSNDSALHRRLRAGQWKRLAAVRQQMREQRKAPQLRDK
ncbi:hypothetical protein ACFST9_13320 [Hymenobacter monticola]|uniref:DUF4131 domain-containing protein n=1 Tax=Hymenobacter monticola TaxID=1705399 RepID=A0ABY4B6X2_9BACT|nr:hypothetical protein [Hymenobacter monticola]UOE34926.1 hypothetical protein MTP16_04550 [Hymenobacter monticola]